MDRNHGWLHDAEKQRYAHQLMHDYFTILFIDNEIAAIAAAIRRRYRLKLPDAIIWATAQARQTLLVTRNSKDFPMDEPSVRIPYVVS